MAPTKHGAYVDGKPSKLYRVWLTMRSRCNNPKVEGYKWYGAKGIKVCERWNDFAVFREDMGDPLPGHTIDRVDSSKGYEPSNCRWATRETQSNNRSGLHIVTLPDGRRMSVARAARATGMLRATLQNRINRRWPANRWFVPLDAEVGRFKKSARD